MISGPGIIDREPDLVDLCDAYDFSSSSSEAVSSVADQKLAFDTEQVLDSSDTQSTLTSVIPNIELEKPVFDILEEGSLGAWLRSLQPEVSEGQPDEMATAVSSEDDPIAALLEEACGAQVPSDTSFADLSSSEDVAAPPAKRARVGSDSCVSDYSSVPSPASVNSSTPSSPKPSSARYQERRRKNNMAAKRSRETRRARDEENERLVVAFQEENEQLRRRKKEMEEEINKLKQQLIERLKTSTK